MIDDRNLAEQCVLRVSDPERSNENAPLITQIVKKITKVLCVQSHLEN